MAAPLPHHILFYDGLCGLCNRLNQFVLKRDPDARFQFASLQSDHAKRILPTYGKDPTKLDTFYVLADVHTDKPRLYERARAGLFVLKSVGWPWRAAGILGVLPTALLNVGYNLLARYRYRLFGRFDTCPLPLDNHKDRFINH